MFKRILRRSSKKVVESSLGATLVGAGMVVGASHTQADGSSSAGGGGGGSTSNSPRAADSGYSGSASYGGSGSYSGSSGSGGTSGSGGSNVGTGTVTNGYQSVSWDGVTQNSWESSMAANGANVTTHSATHSTADFGDGTSASWSGSSGGSGSGSSTPFLKTWNGKKYVFDNDFLFGKPNTAFDNYAEGLVAYKAGKIGGDSYFLKNQPKSENGLLKFQIKEIEPEESFIDSFKLTAVDMPKHFYPVTDGNLKDTYIFDTTKTKTFENQIAHLNFAKNKKVTIVQNVYNCLGPTVAEGKDITLQTGDSIVISLPITSLSDDDTFLLVDSYFRDWTLGNQVPFNTLERVWMQTLKTAKTTPTILVALVMGVFGLFSKETNADLPRYSQTGYWGGGGGFSQTGYSSGGGGYTAYNRRSLVITAKVGNEVVYLQTLFPRYVQASQEVVRIPAELLKKAVGGVLEVCIAATKKHKVRSTFLFTGKTADEEVTFTELEMVSAIKTSTNKDYAAGLAKKDGNFLRTAPSDVINVEIKDAQHKDGYVRHYLLKADGFYTKMSKHTKDLMGDKWYARLDGDSKKLLRNLRVYKS